MWPLILASSMLFTISGMAGSGRDAWNTTGLKGKEQLLEAYRGWYKSASESEKTSEWQAKKTTFFKIFSEAWAAEGMDCIYAGWPSKRQGTCNSPARNNPDYQGGSCSSNELHCQPLFFGEGLCVPVNTRQQRSMAYTQCEENFEKSGRTLSSVIEAIKTNGSEAQLLALLDFADGICANSAQAGTGMCKRLAGKVAAIRDELANAVATIAEVSRAVASVGFGPIVCSTAQAQAQSPTVESPITTVPLEIVSSLPSLNIETALPELEIPQIVVDQEVIQDDEVEVVEVEEIVTEEIVEAEVVVPDAPAAIAPGSVSPVTPSEFVDAALSGPLEFVGSGTITRPTRVEACAFKNEQVYVVYMPCAGDGSQVGMKIISPNGGALDLALQNNGATPSGGLQRSNYNNVWQVGYSKTPRISGTADFNRIAQTVSSGNFADYCSVGPTVSNPNPRCNGNMPGLDQTWLPVARQFWDDPGSKWSTLLNQTEDNISQSR